MGQTFNGSPVREVIHLFLIFKPVAYDKIYILMRESENFPFKGIRIRHTEYSDSYIQPDGMINVVYPELDHELAHRITDLYHQAFEYVLQHPLVGQISLTHLPEVGIPYGIYGLNRPTSTAYTIVKDVPFHIFTFTATSPFTLEHLNRSHLPGVRFVHKYETQKFDRLREVWYTKGVLRDDILEPLSQFGKNLEQVLRVRGLEIPLSGVAISLEDTPFTPPTSTKLPFNPDDFKITGIITEFFSNPRKLQFY